MRDPVTAEALLDRLREEMLIRQDEKWGWPRPVEFLEDDFGAPEDVTISLSEIFDEMETRSRFLFRERRPCWEAIIGEEIGEVGRTGERSGDRVKELIEVAAVALSWAQAILEQDRPGSSSAPPGGDLC